MNRFDFATQLNLYNPPPSLVPNTGITGVDEPDPYNPPTPYGGSGNVYYGTGTSASDINADIVRAEYEDYRNRYIPLENELMRLGLDPEEKRKAVDSAGENVRIGFANSAKQSSMSAQRYGIADPSKMTGASRSRDLAKTKSIAQAKNQTRTAQEDLQMQIMTGAGTSAGSRLGG